MSTKRGSDVPRERNSAPDPGPRPDASAGAAPPPPSSAPADRSRRDRGNMLPARSGRAFVAERLLVRLVATCGIVAIGVAIAAIMVSSGSAGWLVGLVVAIVSVVLSAVLWSSRQV